MEKEKEELKNFFDWRKTVGAKRVISIEEFPETLLLFNINNNLKRIADNLEQITLTFGNFANFMANDGLKIIKGG